ncbi:MAG: alpha/beta hydrolase [Chloroflexota bacterium]
MTGPATRPDTVVLIHGLWLTPLSWENWITRYEARGLKVIAPSWPGMEGTVEELRADPSPMAKHNAKMIANHYTGIIGNLPTKPIIMGHSFGGAFTQLMVDRGLGAAAVPIDSASVRGVLDLPFSTLKSAWPMLRNPLLRHRAIGLTLKEWNYAFCNTMPDAESQKAYDRYAVPGSRNVLLEGANANVNPFSTFHVDFKKTDRAPMLFIGGGKDHTVPAVVSKHNAGKYKAQNITEYKEYPDRPHFTCGAPGWEEVADYALDWALEHAR